MVNTTGIQQDGYSANLDNLLDLKYRLMITFASFIVMFVNGTSFIALNRTRHTPRSARFLSSSLLVFDFMATVFYTVRKVIDDARFNLLFQLFGMGCNFLGYVNIAIMSIERLLLFHWPNFYLRRVSYKVFKRICIVIWLLYSIEWIIETGLCYVFIDRKNIYSMFCFTRAIQRHLIGVYGTSSLVSCTCLFKITLIIANQSSKTMGGKGTWRNNKATVVVFICIVNYLLTTLCGVTMTFVIPENYVRRATNDLLMITNGFVDCCTYVLWFRECRLELLKLFGGVCPGFNKKADKMRFELFDIMTYSKSTTYTSS